VNDVHRQDGSMTLTSCAVSTDGWFVENAIDIQLQQMGAAALRTELARIHDDLMRTFVRCPDWVPALLPSLLIMALRLELGRSALLLAEVRR
jgi:hypothetical protein